MPPASRLSPLKITALIAAVGAVSLVAAILVIGTLGPSSGIPVPFATKGSTLAGSVTFSETRNTLDIYDVRLTNGEISEHLLPDRVYIVHIPADSTIQNLSLDAALTASGGVHAVDYFGYRYSTATATAEIQHVSDASFAARFPAQFFASAIARAQDAAHGGMLAAFEAAKNVTFRPTDGTDPLITIDPAGALYVLIINDANGADLMVREAQQPTPDGPIVNITMLPMPPTAVAASGSLENVLMRFTVSATQQVELQNFLFRALSGSIINAKINAVWVDINSDGVVDQTLAPSAGTWQTLTSGETVIPQQFDWGIAPGQSFLFEVRGGIRDVQMPSGVQLGLTDDPLPGSNWSNFFITGNDGIVNGVDVYGVHIGGVSVNGVCPHDACTVELHTAPTTFWSLEQQHAAAPECGNNVVENGETCDFPSNQSGYDNCTNQCTLAYTSPTLLVSQASLGQGVMNLARGQQHVTLFKFTVDPKENLKLMRFYLDIRNRDSNNTLLALTGALTNMKVFADTDDDGVAETELHSVQFPSQYKIQFDDINLLADGTTPFNLQSDHSITYEVHADVKQTATGTLAIIFDSNATSSMVDAFWTEPTGQRSFLLQSLKLDNGPCYKLRVGWTNCDVIVTSTASPTWTIQAPPSTCGNGTIETGETCDDQNTIVDDGCSETCDTESNFSCTGTPSVCQSYTNFVKALADTNHNGIVSDNEALSLTLTVAVIDPATTPYDATYDVNGDGVINTLDISIILTELDTLAP